ncbi:MAG: hypothetical protein QF393_03385 [Rhodospirillales bacterium]|nr:hypothetical protein [Rhodospirillaceae bacterium]MDP6427037.1 hypothetical protein [Rhodospirillales bacterium]MDP6646628.1 hypothetical protein [Rhodospirillales bacterium]
MTAKIDRILRRVVAKVRFVKQDFVYVAKDDVYRCPTGELLVPVYPRFHMGEISYPRRAG